MTLRSIPILVLLLVATIFFGTSCNRKYGCPAYQSTKTQVSKNGTPKKKASSDLFGKKMRKNR